MAYILIKINSLNIPGSFFCREHCSMDRVTHFTLRTNCRVQPSIISRTRACAAEREMERESEKAGAER